MKSFLLPAGLLLALPLSAQSIPGLDIEGRMNTFFSDAHSGSTTVVSMSTTACNPGSVLGTWEAAPDPNHPMICQTYYRLSGNRFQQISDYSHVKHSFGSTNSNGCGYSSSCVGGAAFSQLGLNCSDTYGSGLNWNRNDLGPREEINPNPQTPQQWFMFGSHFDRGWPQTPANGSISPINPTSNIQFRNQIPDSDLGVPGARYFGQVYYLHEREPETNRENNMSSREMTITTTNASSISGLQYGSVLNRYAAITGARLTSAANYVGGQNRDGRFYIASHVEQLADGWYAYEYAVYNRDNDGKGAEIRFPLCPDGRFRNTGMADVDTNGGNQWTASRQGNELVFTAPASNPHRWDSLFNFWFESDAAPENGMIEIVQATPAAGASASVIVMNDVPTLQSNASLTDACSNATGPDLWAPTQGTLPNPAFSYNLTNVAAGAAVALHLDFVDSSFVFGTCSILNPSLVIGGVANGSGNATFPIPLPNDPSASGASLFVQGVEAEVGGAIIGLADFSNIVQSRLGNSNSGCN